MSYQLRSGHERLAWYGGMRELYAWMVPWYAMVCQYMISIMGETCVVDITRQLTTAVHSYCQAQFSVQLRQAEILWGIHCQLSTTRTGVIQCIHVVGYTGGNQCIHMLFGVYICQLFYTCVSQCLQMLVSLYRCNLVYNNVS